MSATVELTLGHAGAQAFSGPLDLLLAIVRRNGYPLDQLPLAEITRQFTTYLEQHRTQVERDDLELGAEFFETVSWLVLLKSRTLLPGQGEGREVSPAEELRRALVAHEQVRELQGFLGERLEQAGLDAGRSASAFDREQGSVPASNTDSMQAGHVAQPTAPTVQDALVSARRALAAARLHADAKAAADAGMTVEEVLAALKVRLSGLASGETLSTAAWFGEDAPAETQTALLLALLELARLGQLWVHQPAPRAPLWIQRPPETGKPEATAGKRHPRKTAKHPRSSQRKLLAGIPS